VFLSDPRQERLDRVATRTTNDVADEKNPQGSQRGAERNEYDFEE
jgi:hypothetical protein